MNCKPGDLAVIVRSICGNEGKIVHCVRYAGRKLWTDGCVVESLPTWEIDRCIRNANGELLREVPDEDLRPIRPSEGADETLSWKEVPTGKPQEIEA